ncbi:MAG: hypothetical protein KatS3mg110_3689 [Pirellulaceae bacterium]|nr:MAG: hypothetical protein KatS3mg110_3689 [Pirellulaceae bacterium]
MRIDQVDVFILGMVLGAALVGVGVLLAVGVVRRLFPISQPTADQLLQVARQLMRWSRAVADDVAQFDSTLEEFTAASDALAGGDAGDPRAVERVLEANRRLRQRLHQAQITLAKKSALIRELMHRSDTDPLTGIHNRRYLEDQMRRLMAQARRHGRSLSVIFVDVDRFKSINDRCGHAAGDDLLKKTAQRLRCEIREQDVLGRYGGEEFCLLLPDTGLEAACATAERLRSTVAQLPCPGDNHRPVTISCGVAVYSPGETAEQCWNRADQALYAAKRNGRDQVWYHNGARLCRYTTGGNAEVTGCGPSEPDASSRQLRAASQAADGGPPAPRLTRSGRQPDMAQPNDDAVADHWQEICGRLRRRLQEVLAEADRPPP